MTLYTYNARVERVIDADTLVVDIDLGFGVWKRGERIRLAGLNAPELPTDAGKAASLYLLSLLSPGNAPWPIILLTIKDRQDNYGRFLGVVTTPEGVNLNEQLLASGHAVPYPAKAREDTTL